MKTDFEKFAQDRKSVNTNTLSDYRRFASICVPRDGYLSPTIIEERQMNVASMDVFSRLMMERIIFLGVPIDDDVANIVQAQLLYLASTDANADVRIYLNSPGGQVHSGWGIYDTMNIIKPNVSTICTGMAASMAAILLAAGHKGDRKALPHSRIMIHQPLGGTEGVAADIEIQAREILKTRKELYESLAQNTGKSIKQIEKDADRDYWMTSEEAKAYGMIDEVVTAPAKGK